MRTDRRRTQPAFDHSMHLGGLALRMQAIRQQLLLARRQLLKLRRQSSKGFRSHACTYPVDSIDVRI
ncbi:MAG TPA: hypothetical protein PKZ32_05650 [Candidatus Melainabacteria bacterium]|nr:hypothetical protein [Candidatus Melainabacteria bacterium]